MFGRLKPLDYVVFIMVTAVSAGSVVWVYGGGSADRLRIGVSGPGGNWLYPLNAVETVSVAGPLGDTVVQIGGGRARVISSPCRNQICVAAPPVHRYGQWIACLPNQVMVRVDSPASAAPAEAVDGVAW